MSALTLENYRWGIALWAIVFPATFLPLAVVFKFYEKKAQQQGLFIRERSGRTFVQSFIHYFHEFDSKFHCHIFGDISDLLR